MESLETKPWWEPVNCWKVDMPPTECEMEAMNALSHGAAQNNFTKLFISDSVETNLNTPLKVQYKKV